MAYNRLIGNIGEDIACKWLLKNNFQIIERNYNRKWGEIDIIARKEGMVQFIEVKSMTLRGNEPDGHRPEENVHDLKQRRLKRAIQTYMIEKKYGLDAEFKFHVMVVLMNSITRRAKVTFLENIIL